MQASSFPCLILPLALGVGILLFRGTGAETRSRRLGILAAAFGVAGFIPALLGPTFKDPSESNLLLTCGLITILLALSAIVLSIWTFRVRRRDSGVETSYPLAGILCGIVNLFLGTGVFVAGSGEYAPMDGIPWTWRCEQYDFEVTVPSERWKLKPNENVLAQFVCSRPDISGLVGEVVPASSDIEYEKVLAHGRKLRGDSPMTDTYEYSGPNRHGHSFWVSWGDAKNGDTGHFVGVSVTRLRDKAVIMIVEGRYRLATEIGHDQESRAFRAQAELFLGSVK
jgi:hypothetical protein